MPLKTEKKYELFKRIDESATPPEARVGVRDLSTQKEVYPSCGKDLEVFYSYLEGVRAGAEPQGRRLAQELLEQVLNGKTPISDMVRAAQEVGASAVRAGRRAV